MKVTIKTLDSRNEEFDLPEEVRAGGEGGGWAAGALDQRLADSDIYLLL